MAAPGTVAHGDLRAALAGSVAQLKDRAAASGAVQSPPVRKVPAARLASFSDFYDIPEGKSRLGTGSYSSVHKCIKRGTNPPETYAVKIMRKAPSVNYDALRREVEILSSVQHPNVVRLFDCIEDDNCVFLILEYMAGGELFDRIVKQHPRGYTEARCVLLFRNLLKAVAHLHANNIIHRDLKPENLLLASPDTDCVEVKVSDFGFATVRFLAVSACGSPYYLAPEIIRNAAAIQRGAAGPPAAPYSNAVDMWSLGVILYVLLCGFAPFREATMPKLFQRVLDCEYSFPDPYWSNVSPLARDLVSKLIVADPAQRISAAAALQHPWLTSSPAAAAAARGEVEEGPVLQVAESLAMRERRGGQPVFISPDVVSSLNIKG
eukprot:TRINITY_DN1394_c0_g1_i1.p1 TRINITY_DN1394_c0_g1~~TRINITY_DN1394_c0_g1_i1.p1  ORF type:complete len:378 (-),score=50.23 TRINITY_DN1394_c0_g1_i1:1381-2514(-)